MLMNIKYAIDRVYNGILNVIEYFPIIYRDRDWDFSHYEELLLFKLKRMHTCLKDSAPNEPAWAESIKALRICINVLERRKEDFYIEIVREADLMLAINIEKRDLKLLYTLLHDYSEYWWD